MTSADDTTLKIYCEEGGRCWTAQGAREAVAFPGDMEDLLENMTPRYERLRLVGHWTQAALLCRLWGRKLAAQLESVQVCSPALCVRRGDARGDVVIMRMRSLKEAASRGGWHEFDERDYPSYAMAALQAERNFSWVSPAALMFLRQHPVWPLLSFLPGLDERAAALLLAAILDPRFYTHPDVPDRPSRLEAYLGLSLQFVKHIRHVRSEAAVVVWQGLSRSKRCSAALDVWDSLPNSSAALAAPEHFLHRLIVHARDVDHGYLKAARLFINLLRQYWLDRLAGANVPDRLFAPRYLLEAEVAEALEDHLRRHQPLVS